MQNFLINLFGDFGRIIVFLHIIGASFLLGSMLTIRFIIKQSLTDIHDDVVRYGVRIRILEKYFRYLAATMILIVSVSLAMSVGLGFEYANPTLFSLIHVKEALWVFISFNFIFMYIKLMNSRRLFRKREFFEVHENLKLIVNYLMTLNIVLTFIAAYIGVIIRGF